MRPVFGLHTRESKKASTEQLNFHSFSGKLVITLLLGPLSCFPKTVPGPLNPLSLYWSGHFQLWVAVTQLQLVSQNRILFAYVMKSEESSVVSEFRASNMVIRTEFLPISMVGFAGVCAAFRLSHP